MPLEVATRIFMLVASWQLTMKCFNHLWPRISCTVLAQKWKNYSHQTTNPILFFKATYSKQTTTAAIFLHDIMLPFMRYMYLPRTKILWAHYTNMCFHFPLIIRWLKCLLTSFRSFWIIFLSEDEERAKKFIQSISWASKSKAVNLATLRKTIWVQR